MAKKETKDTKFYMGVGVVALLLIALFIFFPTQKMQLGGSEFVQAFGHTNDAVMLDVRTPTEFAAGHLDKAINVDYENASFESEIKKLDPAKTYFVYCRSGNRSGKSITIMRANGFQHIFELKGGIVSSKDSIKLIPSSIQS
jgi:rhodanese-related sulfurtransferase